MTIAVASRLRFDPNDARVEFVAEGGTLAEIIAAQVTGATRDQIARLRVTLVTAKGEWLIPRENWRLVTPKAGATVRIMAVVAGGNVLRSVLSIAVLAAATIFLAPASGVAIGLAGALGITAQAASAIAIGVATAVSAVAINALLPSGQQNQDKPEDRYSINGTRNQVNPWGPIPDLLGRMRITPPHGTGQYSEVVGDDIYLRAALLIGRGGIEMSDWRLGETAITPLDGSRTFGGVEIENKAGWDTDTPLTLVEECVFEDAYNVALKSIEDPTVRRTASRCDAVSIDVSFNALVATDEDDGDKHALLVEISVGYRKLDDEGGPPGSWLDAGSMVIVEQKEEPFRRSKRIEFDEPGTYEVRLQRVTPDQDWNDSVVDEATWAVMRSIRHEYPFQYEADNLALFGIRIKASKQLSGTINELNLIGEKHILDWDAGTEAWVLRATSNPASIYRYVLQGKSTARARSDAELDLDAIQEWHEWCEEKGLTYNRYHDFDQGTRETLAQIAAAGRATVSQAGGKWSVVIDRPQTVLMGHITQRNASSFSGEMSYRTIPDAFRVRFLDENDDWRPREIVVERPGLVGEPQLYEQIEFPGYTTYALNYRAALRSFAELELRPETFWCTQDFEQLFAPRGGIVLYQHAILSDASASARVKEIGTLDDGSARTYVVLDDLVTMVDGSDYVIRFRYEDGSFSLYQVETEAGETDTLYLGSLLDGEVAVPGLGDLAMFGLEDSESIECIIKAIEPMKNFAARLTLQRHAPEIEALADGGEIPTETPEPSDPPWAARTPAEPEIYRISSGPDELDLDAGTSPVMVYVRNGGSVPVNRYVVSAQRGMETPVEVTVSASSGRALFDDEFEPGDVLSLTAVAVTAYDLESDPSDPISYTVKARTDLPADIASLSFLELADGTRHYAWTLDPAATDRQRSRIAGYVIKAAPGSGLAWGDLDRINEALAAASPLDSPYPLTSGGHTIGVASIDYRGRICANPKLIDVTMGASSASRRGRLDASNPGQSALIAAI